MSKLRPSAGVGRSVAPATVVVRALKEAWVKSTGGTLGDERGVNRQVAVWRVGEKVNFFQKG